MSRALIEHGADVNAANDNYGNGHGRTALHYAAEKNNIEVIDVLVDAGANIEARTHGGASPLHSAATSLKFEALVILLRHGARVNALDTHRETPLRWAVDRVGHEGTAEMVDTLLRAGADEKILNHAGETAVDALPILAPGRENLAEGVERVRELLVTAPADRAWRRRGYLVLCRAHPDRMKPVHESSSAYVSVAHGTRSCTKLARTVACGCNDPVGGGAVHGGSSGGWFGAVERVLGLQEEGMFRAVVGYL